MPMPMRPMSMSMRPMSMCFIWRAAIASHAHPRRRRWRLAGRHHPARRVLRLVHMQFPVVAARGRHVGDRLAPLVVAVAARVAPTVRRRFTARGRLLRGWHDVTFGRPEASDRLRIRQRIRSECLAPERLHWRQEAWRGLARRVVSRVGVRRQRRNPAQELHLQERYRRGSEMRAGAGKGRGGGGGGTETEDRGRGRARAKDGGEGRDRDRAWQQLHLRGCLEHVDGGCGG
jgi:hypothetical protein